MHVPVCAKNVFVHAKVIKPGNRTHQFAKGMMPGLKSRETISFYPGDLYDPRVF
jgi:hypothetical protein